jgi:triphosphoribosyl-dephospho-CoA synthetase
MRLLALEIAASHESKFSLEITVNPIDTQFAHVQLLCVTDEAGMSTPEQTVVANYLKQFAELARKKSEIESRMRQVERTCQGIIDLVDDEVEQKRLLEDFDEVVRPAGLTNAIRQALEIMAGNPVTPKDVRIMVAPYVEGHANPLASVHTVLKRLAKTDDVQLTEKNGAPAYRWARTRLARAMANAGRDLVKSPSNTLQMLTESVKKQKQD